MTELKVAEEYWPTGGPADTLRALLICRMFEAGKGSQESGRLAAKIWTKLNGDADPAKENKRGMAPAEIKLGMSGFT